MSITQPSRRLLLTTTSLHQPPIHPLLPLCTHHRHLFNRLFNRTKKPKQPPGAIDTSSPDFQKRLAAARETSGDSLPPSLNSGDLSSSIFGKLDSPKSQAAQPRRLPPQDDAKGAVLTLPLGKPTARDPRPKARIRWHRKMVLRDVRGRHRMNKTEKVLRSERFHVAKSPLIKTSVKKLFPLARQIAGKPLAEAMVQMRFSKKKAAADVLRHLDYARNQAVVVKGMGLGRSGGGGDGEGEAKGKKKGRAGLLVEDKKGKTREVDDLSAMYVDEAWVGRGPYDFGTDYRARGRAYRLHLPWTSISVVLKEEATRVRQEKEREEKRLRKKVWVPLPDRKVTAQRQYPLW